VVKSSKIVNVLYQLLVGTEQLKIFNIVHSDILKIFKL